MTKTISIDLDGVLNTYDGYFDEKVIPPAREGAREFLEQLSNDYEIEIYTTRNKKQTFLWLQENELLKYVYDISNVKNQFTSIFIDDRAITFEGDFSSVISKAKAFIPYWKK